MPKHSRISPPSQDLVAALADRGFYLLGISTHEGPEPNGRKRSGSKTPPEGADVRVSSVTGPDHVFEALDRSARGYVPPKVGGVEFGQILEPFPVLDHPAVVPDHKLEPA